MEGVKTNEEELTSTMGSLLSTNKDEKSDASDSTPTSSTDAFTTTSTSHLAADDPISSTSSDVVESRKNTEKMNDITQSSANKIHSNPILSSVRNISSVSHRESIVSEKDLLDMNITDTSTEKITENVDDIVQDLENLLGEPTTTFNFTIKPRDTRNVKNITENKDISMDLDELAADFQLATEEPKEAIKEDVNIKTTEVNHQSDAIKTEDLQNIKESDSDCPADNSASDIPIDFRSNQEEIASSESPPVEPSASNSELNVTEQNNIKNNENSECNVRTETEINKEQYDKSEASAISDVTSTHSKEEEESIVDSDMKDPSNSTSIKDMPEDKEEQPSELIISQDVIENVPIEETDRQYEESASTTQETIPGLEATLTASIIESHPNEEEESQKGELLEHEATPSTSIMKSHVNEDEENQKCEVPEHEATPIPSISKKDVNKEEEENQKCEVPEHEVISTPSITISHVSEEDENQKCEVLEHQATSTPLITISPVSEEEENQKCEVPEHEATPTPLITISYVSEEEENQKSEVPKHEATPTPSITESRVNEEEENRKYEVPELETTATPSVTKSHVNEEKENRKCEDSNLIGSGIIDENVPILEDVTEKRENVPSEESEPASNVITFQNDEVPASSEINEDKVPINECALVKDNQHPMDVLETDEKEVANLSEIEVPQESSHQGVETLTVDKVEEEASGHKTEIEVAAEFLKNEEITPSSIVETVPESVTQSSRNIGDAQLLSSLKLEERQICHESSIQTDIQEITPMEVEEVKPEVTQSTEEVVAPPESNKSNVVPRECVEALSAAQNEIPIEPIIQSILEQSGDIQEASSSDNLIQSVSMIEDQNILPTEDSLGNDMQDNLEIPTVPVEVLKILDGTSTEEPTDPVDSVQPIVDISVNDNQPSTSVTEENELPLVMEDIPEFMKESQDLEVLNAISSLSDNKPPDLIPDMSENLENNDTLLSSTTLQNEEPNTEGVPFEPCVGSTLPTVEEIFAEPSVQQPVELQDENLETLLAVASLEGVCENVTDYSIAPVEDISTFEPDKSTIENLPQEPEFDKSQDENIEVLHEQKEETVEVIQEVSTVELTNLAMEVLKKQEVGQPQEDKLKEPLVINIDDVEKDRPYSPKITIKPIKPSNDEVTSVSGDLDEKESNKGSLKMTITKQSDTMHSILKIYDPDDDQQNQEQQESDSQLELTVPKLIIKPIVQPNEQPQSPKMSTRSSKQVFSPTSSSQRSSSPRITIKPIVKPENIIENVGSLKITIKPVLKSEDVHRQKHSPKLTIKPIIKPEEESSTESKMHSPRVTIKPIVKPADEMEQVPSPRITIKPIVKPVEIVPEPSPSTPRVTIKPVVKPVEKEKNIEIIEQPVERSSPKITIKPIVKPQEPELQLEDFEESIKERIVLKINKGTIPSSSKELRKRELPQEEEKSEKLAKIKLKFSKEGGHPHIVQDESHHKRPMEQLDHEQSKRQKIEIENTLPSGVTITPISPSHSKLKEMLSSGRSHFSSDKVVTIEDDDDEVSIVEDAVMNKSSPIVISEESNQDSVNVALEVRDPISEIPVFEITPDSVKTINPQPAPPIVEVPVTVPPAPRKRGRPRKVPLEVREDFKEIPKEEEPKPIIIESTRPKRSCRGPSVRTTLGIKPRKPRGGGRGRGSKRGMGTRSTPTPPETPPKSAKELKLSTAKLKQLKEDLLLLSDKSEVKQIEIDDGFLKSPSHSLLAPPHSDNSITDRADIVMYEEETRMSAETSSRAQTPAKQVVSSAASVDLVEESQSSVQSTATTESVKVRKGPRLEVHQEPEGAVISADQLAEYYWSGGGPYMLQEQVAQFLGIKSFKRKYPNIPRRVVDMQERDFIRESGLAGEAMCDLGLTAVNSTDILDIMYSDFQDKYEEYCKHQRDRQAKDLTNKQRALSLAASQEKTKMDITQQAVQSAAAWNANFNKARRDQRKACMDLQTLTVHFPKGKVKQINRPKLGHYPVALVPGQFTDYYKEFTPTEINNLPFNTLCYKPIIKGQMQEMDCDSQTDGSGSESETSTSDSDSSYTGSSDGEDCTLCKPSMKRVAAAQ